MQFRELPVIMISALEELQSVVRCIEMGAVDYLPKPFNRVLLRARIGASLERKRLMDRERRKTEELERTLTLLEEAQDQLVIQASRDTLTGLANRRTVELQLEARVKRGEPFTAIYIDLNGFKKINDTYGHAAGDELLRQVGERLRSAFRAGDTIGRWGGDEFVAFVEGGAAEMARIKAALEKEYYYHATVILALDRVSEKSRGRVYVHGSVKAQGPQEVPPDETYTVSKAIIRAGGFGDFANKRKVKVTHNGKEYTVDLKRIIEEGHTDEDMALNPDDQIYVPQRLINM